MGLIGIIFSLLCGGIIKFFGVLEEVKILLVI